MSFTPPLITSYFNCYIDGKTLKGDVCKIDYQIKLDYDNKNLGTLINHTILKGVKEFNVEIEFYSTKFVFLSYIGKKTTFIGLGATNDNSPNFLPAMVYCKGTVKDSKTATWDLQSTSHSKLLLNANYIKYQDTTGQLIFNEKNHSLMNAEGDLIQKLKDNIKV